MKVYTTKTIYRLWRRKVRNIFPLKKDLQHGGNEKYLYRNTCPKLKKQHDTRIFLKKLTVVQKATMFPRVLEEPFSEPPESRSKYQNPRLQGKF
jgi:hypothetical protein